MTTVFSLILRHIFIILCVTFGNDMLLKISAEKPSIAKCCEFNEHFYVDNDLAFCKVVEEDLDFSEFPIYDAQLQKTNQRIKTSFEIVRLSFFNISMAYVFYAEDDETFKSYLTESGILYLEKPNDFNRWTKRENYQFCIDYEIVGEGENMTAQPAFWIVLSDLEPKDLEEHKEWNIFVTFALFVSCFFLIITLAVYIILPDLRNLCGMILMAYVFTLLVGYLTHAITRVLVLGELEHITCLNLTLSIYYLLLSSFFWMNVMSFDIWWTFRGYAKARPIHRRGECFKFMVYSAYAWGVPFAMTVGVYVLMNMNLRHIPGFIKPDIECFLTDGTKLLYMYTPMLILIMCNWMFFAMTAYNVWRLSRNTGVLDSAAAGRPADHRSQRSRLMVYVKLSVVMGVSWVLEIVSYFTPALKVWHLTDAYHALIGLIIFLIFICKGKILRKCVKRMRQSKSFRKPTYKGHSTNTTDSEFSTQETPLQVCPNPSGLYYKQC